MAKEEKAPSRFLTQAGDLVKLDPATLGTAEAEEDETKKEED